MANKAIVLSGNSLTEAVLTQDNSHGSPDTDASPTALHHTLGTGANQAAAGNHTHAGGDASRIVGEITLWPTETAPAQWLLCYGQAVSRSTYSGLFAVIGTTFGSGNGSTTFNLPDMRGRLPLGQDDMGGAAANRVTAAAADTIGGSSGAETHTLITSELPAHNHPQRLNNNAAAYAYTSAGANTSNETKSTASGTRLSTDNTGSGSPHNNMPPYLTLNYIIFAGA